MCSRACMMLLAMPWLDQCVLCVYFHTIWLDPCLHILYAWIHVLPCLCVKFLHVSMPICLDLCFHMLLCLDLCSLHALCNLPCACALHAMFVCLDLGYVCHAMRYCSPFVTLSFFLVIIQTHGLCHHPYTKDYIKGFGSSLFFMSTLAWFYAL